MIMVTLWQSYTFLFWSHLVQIPAELADVLGDVSTVFISAQLL
jgi:hypothetical protein